MTEDVTVYLRLDMFLEKKMSNSFGSYFSITDGESDLTWVVREVQIVT